MKGELAELPCGGVHIALPSVNTVTFCWGGGGVGETDMCLVGLRDAYWSHSGVTLNLPRKVQRVLQCHARVCMVACWWCAADGMLWAMTGSTQHPL